MRSKIFMPGDSPNELRGMLETGADTVSIDLEDTVTPDRKDFARHSTRDLLRASSAAELRRILVRVNTLDSGRFQNDVHAVVSPGLQCINLPKPESADDVRSACEVISACEREQGMPHGTVRLLVNIESPRGLRLVHEIATASDRTMGLQIGYADLLEPYRISRRDLHAVQHIRVQVRLASAEAGLRTYDGVFGDVADPEFFRLETQGARALGFSGKSCFNAEQVRIVNDVFSPTAKELSQANRVVAEAEKMFAQGKGIFELDGKIVDEPFVEGARQIIAYAEEIERLRQP